MHLKYCAVSISKKDRTRETVCAALSQLCVLLFFTSKCSNSHYTSHRDNNEIPRAACPLKLLRESQMWENIQNTNAVD